MKNEELAAQVSALDLKPDTAVVLRLTQDTPADVARKMGQELQKHVPFGTQIFVLPNGQGIETIDEAQMRELGWVRQSAVDEALATIDELADASTAVSNVAYNLGQKHSEWSDTISPAISRLDAARNAARGAVKRVKGG